MARDGVHATVAAHLEPAHLEPAHPERLRTPVALAAGLPHTADTGPVDDTAELDEALRDGWSVPA
jgi:hypothetical protein